MFDLSIGESTCYGGLRLSQSGYGNLPNYRQVYVGNPEVCVNGTYSPICQDLLTDDLAQLVCQNSFDSNYSELFECIHFVNVAKVSNRQENECLTETKNY